MRLEPAKFLFRVRRLLGGRMHSRLMRLLNPSRGRYLAPGLTFAEFQAKLKERAISHVLLSPSFDAMRPEVLVADAGLERLSDLVTPWPVGPEIKLYAASGRPGFSFRPTVSGGSPQSGTALLPPLIAEKLLSAAGSDDATSGMLGAREAFLIYAYRATYLEPGCWVTDERGGEWLATPRCAEELRRLAVAARMELPDRLTAAELDRFLEGHGWRPSFDLMERVAQWMPWIQGVLCDQAEAPEQPGIAAFFLRQRAVQAGFKDIILESLQDNGFEALLVIDLEPAQGLEAATAFRGGDWGAGPYKVSGGPPAVLAVTVDLLPLPPGEKQLAMHPSCDNAKIIKAKLAARDIISNRLPPAERYNALHSTDNSAQAWRVVRLLLPGQEQALRAKADQMRHDFATEGAIKDLSRHGRRAKVELIEFDGDLAVRKTFRSTALRFMEREIEVLTALSPLRAEFPKLLGRGSNHIIVEYVGEGEHLPVQSKGGRPNPLPLAKVRQLASVLKTCLGQGFDPLDLRAPGNISFTASGMKLIDYELWRQCDPNIKPEESLCLRGVPPTDDERPRGIRCISEPYRVGWFPYTLLSIESFLHDPAWLQHVKRSINFLMLSSGWGARAILRRGRRFAITAIKSLTTGSGIHSPPPRGEPRRVTSKPAVTVEKDAAPSRQPRMAPALAERP